jgi:hypothetical protein
MNECAYMHDHVQHDCVRKLLNTSVSTYFLFMRPAFVGIGHHLV